MALDRWIRLRELFEGALAVDGPRREAFLRETCPDDQALRLEAASLVAAHERAGGFLDAAVLRGGLNVDPAHDEDDLSGRLIDEYLVLGLIGRGGMGAVYRAQRADDAYEKVVAFKVVKRGMDTAAVLARFRAERSILARLEHPHIAHLIDGGSTEDGRPYLVMEYVEGERIDRWADARGLDTRGRLRLVLDVCAAVSHAHHGLVVHRDLKPANVLVTAEGVVKLLDFGIAKLLDPAAADNTIPALVPMTPEYASPEQLRGEPVNTAADVYSLGVLLYELLTGRRPFKLGSRHPDEVARIVCEQEPERPSTAASRRAEAETTTAAGGAATVRRARELAGDLDAMVMMALRKEPERRYSSVEQLADDIRRHLEGRPVRARPDTFAYRAGKFVRRNRLAVTLGALVAANLAAGLTITLWQARVLRAERARSEQRFQDVRRMANQFLFEFHDSIAEVPGATRARELVVRRAAEYLDKLAAQAGDDPALLLELADAYEKLGTVQGGSGQANLGDTGGALDSYGKGLDALRRAAEARPLDDEVGTRLASQNMRLGRLLSSAGRYDEALARQQEALAAGAAVLKRDPGHLRARMALLNVHRAIGYERDRRGDTAGGLDSFRTALAMARALVDERPDDPEARAFLARSYESVSDGLVRSGDLGGALQTFEAALKLRQEAAARDPGNGPARRNVAVVHMDLGDVQRDLGRPREALRSYRQALAIHDALVAADPGNIQSVDDRFVSYAQMCQLAVMTERVADGHEVCGRALADARAVAAGDPASAIGRERVGNAQVNLGRYRLVAGDALAGVQHLREGAAVYEQLSSEAPGSADAQAQLAEVRTYLGEALLAAGRAAEAKAAHQQAVSALEPLAAADPLDAALQHLLAASYQRMGAAQGPACGPGRAWYEKALAVWAGLRAKGQLRPREAPLADRVARETAACGG